MKTLGITKKMLIALFFAFSMAAVALSSYADPIDEGLRCWNCGSTNLTDTEKYDEWGYRLYRCNICGTLNEWYPLEGEGE